MEIHFQPRPERLLKFTSVENLGLHFPDGRNATPRL